MEQQKEQLIIDDQSQPIIWRDTFGDNYIAVRNFAYEVRELETDKLKDWKHDFEKVVTANINYMPDQYPVKGFVYHQGKNIYLQIKKFDDARKIYVCKPKQGDEEGNEEEKQNLKEQEDVEVAHEEISDQIIINVRFITEDAQVSGQIQISINEKIANLKDYYASKGGNSLNTVYKGELIKGDDTFLKRLVKAGENFILISGSFEAKKWKRFPKIEQSDYFYMSETYYDAVIFKPKKDIYFLGFGMLNQYEKKNFKVKFKYNIESVDSQEYEYDITQDMAVENMFEIDFQKIGIAPIAVKTDTPIHVCAKIQMDGPYRFNYGYDGYNPDRIEGQEPDFSTERSDFNQNSTGQDFGQFPYILYAT